MLTYQTFQKDIHNELNFYLCLKNTFSVKDLLIC